MANNLSMINLFQDNLMKLAKSIIWKNKREANKYEENVNPYDVDRYIAACQGIITFENLSSISYETLLNYFNNEECAEFVLNKEKIPLKYRDSIVSIEVKKIIDNYVEKNNYYRMLYGLPDINDTNYIYITDQDDIDPTIPIHLLDLTNKYRLTSRGIIDKLIKENPSKKYLKYLTDYNIEPWEARIAEPFDILYADSTDPENIGNQFRELYNNCREYILKVHYTSAYKLDNENYEGFIAMTILFMAIQKMFAKYIEADVSRDFFDLYSLKLIYDSYGVPFYEELPLEYHKNIIKNINRLIAMKGSNQIVIDICNLFSFDNIELYQYYLAKLHKLDNENKPIFSYDENGKEIYNDMYKLAFISVPIGENPYLYINNERYHKDYFSVTNNDPYWINDEELLNKIYSSEFNYQESKYLGIQIAFDITKITYESSFFFRMLEDNKEFTNKLFLSHDYAGIKVSLFDMSIYLSALICRSKGISGQIPSEPEKLSKVYGFSFKQDLSIIQESIKKSKYLDNKICDLIVNMNIDSLDDVRRVFQNIIDLKNLIDNKITNTNSVEEYKAYKEIRQILLTTLNLKKVYTDNTGNVASSFKTLLESRSSILYYRLENMNDDDIDSEINYCIKLIEKFVDNLKYIRHINSLKADGTIKYIDKLLSFFKSVKVDLNDFNIIITINSKADQMIKLLLKHHISYTMCETKKDKFTFEELIKMYRTISIGDDIDFIDKIIEKISILYPNDQILFTKEQIDSVMIKWINDNTKILYKDNIDISFTNKSLRNEDVIIAFIHELRNTISRKYCELQFNDKIFPIKSFKDLIADSNNMKMIDIIDLIKSSQSKKCDITFYDILLLQKTPNWFKKSSFGFKDELIKVK